MSTTHRHTNSERCWSFSHLLKNVEYLLEHRTTMTAKVASLTIAVDFVVVASNVFIDNRDSCRLCSECHRRQA